MAEDAESHPENAQADQDQAGQDEAAEHNEALEHKNDDAESIVSKASSRRTRNSAPSTKRSSKRSIGNESRKSSVRSAVRLDDSQIMQASEPIIPIDTGPKADYAESIAAVSEMGKDDDVISKKSGYHQHSSKASEDGRLSHLSRASSPKRKEHSGTNPTREGAESVAASSSSHLPYQVAFESEEPSLRSSIPTDTDVSRILRERLLKSYPMEVKDLEKFSATLTQLQQRVNSETNNLENVLDLWCRELRQALVTESVNTQKRVLQEFEGIVKELLQSRQKEVDRLAGDIDSLHNLCRSYSKAINQRDKTISNLADALALQREEVTTAKNYAVAKIELEEGKLERFREVVATKYHQRVVLQRFFKAWHSVVRERWQTRVGKACQKRAEEVCHQMADQYESRIAELEKTIAGLKDENRLYRKERDQVALKARNALLHGVSVLKTEVSHFPGISEDGSQPASRKSSKVDSSHRDNTGRTETSSELTNGHRRDSRRSGQSGNRREIGPGDSAKSGTSLDSKASTVVSAE